MRETNKTKQPNMLFLHYHIKKKKKASPDSGEFKRKDGETLHKPENEKKKIRSMESGPSWHHNASSYCQPVGRGRRPPAVYQGLNLEAEITKEMEEANPAPKELILNWKTSPTLVVGLTV